MSTRSGSTPCSSCAQPARSGQGASASLAVDVVPLSQIAEGELLDPHRAQRERQGDGSVASSSWATLSSHCSSAFSHVSNDSLSELVGPLGGTTVK